MASNIELEGRSRRLLLRGACLDLLPLCEAMCCREWAVVVSAQEYASGSYQADVHCGASQKTCTHEARACRYRSYALKKKPDGSCIHLGEDNRCTIYESRPRVCRDFTSAAGWRLGSVFSPAPARPLPDSLPDPSADKEDFLAHLTDDMTFVQHPLIKLRTLFCRKGQGDVIFVKQIAGGCELFHTHDEWRHPFLGEAHLLALIDLFNRKDNLGLTLQRFRETCSLNLSQGDFYEIVWLLNRHSIIADSKIFSGMLRGERSV